MWNGKFWVRVKSDPPLSELPPPTARPAPIEFAPERRSLRLGGVLAAAVVGVALGHLHINLPGSGSLESTVKEMLVANLLWGLFTNGCVVLILSVGRQGIDVLLLRAIAVGFILGATLLGLGPLPIMGWVWLLAIFVSGLIYAALAGPILAVFAVLANLLWYRSFRSLRPQLPVFNRGS
jgi:hypothetical protein